MARLVVLLSTICIGLALVLPHFRRLLQKRLLAIRSGCKEPRTVPGVDYAALGRDASKQQRYLDVTGDLFKKYGRTHKIQYSGKTIIRTCDPEVSKAVFSTHFEEFGLQPIRYENAKSFFGNGILITDGEHWKASRALVRPAFDVAHIRNFDRLKRHTDRFIEILPRDGSTIDLLPLLRRLVSRSE